MKAAINYLGNDFIVTFDYQPSEPMTRDYPGCGAEVEIIHIEYNGADVTDLIYNICEFDDLETLCHQEMNPDE